VILTRATSFSRNLTLILSAMAFACLSRTSSTICCTGEALRQHHRLGAAVMVGREQLERRGGGGLRRNEALPATKPDFG
jgi:hypothetical protein